MLQTTKKGNVKIGQKKWGDLKTYIIKEEKSINTPENFIYSKEIIEKLFPLEAIKIAYMARPLQQFRSHATFFKILMARLTPEQNPTSLALSTFMPLISFFGIVSPIL